MMTRCWCSTELRCAIEQLRSGVLLPVVATRIDRTPGAIKQMLRGQGHSYRRIAQHGANKRRTWAVERYLQNRDAASVARAYTEHFGQSIKARVVLRWVQLAQGGGDGRTARRKLKPWMDAEIVKRRHTGTTLAELAAWAGVSVGTIRRILLRHCECAGVDPVVLGFRRSQ